ncbi:MAG: AAA ATPase [Vezdaea aestivalis]|nr:MAG: AAA ATPase [Vezdaea aestivalis]
MPSILGKRIREPVASLDLDSQRTRSSKRRVQPKIFFDDTPCDIPSKRKAEPLVVVETENVAPKQEDLVVARASKRSKRQASSSETANCSIRSISSPSIPTNENVKSLQLTTPKTQRHRDALRGKVPSTPKHRVQVPGKPFTPRTPSTPGTPQALPPTIYNSARKLFVRSANPLRLIGREVERNQISKFIRSHVETKTGGAMYISGPPGTGKSALVEEICRILSIDLKDMEQVYINCMSMKTSKDVFARLAEKFDMKETDDGFKMSAKLQTLFTGPSDNTSKTFVVTLDEIDHLLSLDLEALYTVFEWSFRPKSRLVLVGIANALDLTNRFLPRLKANGLKPMLLPFLPYTAPQISTVVTTRLKTLNEAAQADFVPFIHPAAIQFCSKKVANQTGDLRKVFELCRKAIDVVEAETREKLKKQTEGEGSLPSPSKTPLAENLNCSSPSVAKSPAKTPVKRITQALAELTPSTAPRATIAHVAKISSDTFGNGTVQRLQGINLQQKAALCALLALERKKRMAMEDLLATPSKSARAPTTVRGLYESYSLLCKQERLLQPLTSVEFRDVVNSLETLSLINVLNGKNSSFNIFSTPSKRARGGMCMNSVDDMQIGSSVTEKELQSAIQGPGHGLLKAILTGEGLW